MFSRSTITQRVQTNYGTVIGEYHAAPGAKPPSVESIIGYLDHVAKAYDHEYSAPGMRIWRGPFYARFAGQAMGRRFDLLSLVDDLFATDGVDLIRPAIVLLSEPGVGNTSALMYIADRMAERSLRTFKKTQEEAQPGESVQFDGLIPLFIPLSELHPNQYFLTLVQAAFNRDAPKPITLDETHMLLKEYHCLLLLDELEMVGNLGSAEGLLLTRQFIDLYASERFVVSCRDSSYYDQLGQLETYRVDELTEEEVESRLRDEFGDELEDEEIRALLTYGRNRSMLEIYLERRKAGPITSLAAQISPKSRAHLLHEMIRKVLAAAGSKNISDELLEDILEQVGYRMHMDHTLRYSEEQLVELIRRHLEAWGERQTTVRQVLQVFQQTGVMQREEQRFWRFHIRPTQAYFAAAAMARDPEKTQAMLADVSNHWWREPLEAFIGLTNDPNDLLFSLIDRDPLTAARSIRYAGQPINQSTVNAVIDALLERMKYAPSEVRADIVRVMGRECRPPVGILWNLLYSEPNSNVLLALARTIAHRSRHSYIDTRRYKVAILDERDVQEAMREVIGLWRDCDPSGTDEKRRATENRLVEILNGPARSKNPRLVKGVAAMALGAIGSQVAQEQLFQQLLQKRPSDFISWCIVDALTQIRRKELKSDVMRLYHGGARQQLFAVYLLGWVGHWRVATGIGYQPGRTLDILQSALVNKRNAKLRGYGAQSLGMLGLPGAAALLEETLNARTESEPWVLRKSVKALGKVGSVNAIAVLEPYLWDESAVIRRRTREAIAEIERRFELA